MNYRKLNILAFLLALTMTKNICSANNTVTSSTTNNAYCPSLKQQPLLNLEQIMGKWYVVEVVKHKIDVARSFSIGHETTTVKTCPVVQLRFIDSRSEIENYNGIVRLLWTEDAGNLEYSFSLPDFEKTPGLWNSKSLQNGTLTTQRYVQFIGSVQVVKATPSRMVLTFCSLTVRDQLFSVILSRKDHLQESYAMGVQSMLSKHGLTIESVKETCINVEGITAGQ